MLAVGMGPDTGRGGAEPRRRPCGISLVYCGELLLVSSLRFQTCTGSVFVQGTQTAAAQPLKPSWCTPELERLERHRWWGNELGLRTPNAPMALP